MIRLFFFEHIKKYKKQGPLLEKNSFKIFYAFLQFSDIKQKRFLTQNFFLKGGRPHLKKLGQKLFFTFFCNLLKYIFSFRGVGVCNILEMYFSTRGTKIHINFFQGVVGIQIRQMYFSTHMFRTLVPCPPWRWSSHCIYFRQLKEI